MSPGDAGDSVVIDTLPLGLVSKFPGVVGRIEIHGDDAVRRISGIRYYFRNCPPCNRGIISAHSGSVKSRGMRQ